MKKPTRTSLAIVFVVVVLSMAIAGGSTLVGPPLTQGVLTSQTPVNSRVQTIQFESKLVGKSLPYNVLLPVNYDQPNTRTKRYPVIYLLHGLTGHYTNWLEKTKLVDYTAPYEFIIVMPEGNDGWYTDSATVPTDKYESYILQELIPDVEKRFRASSDAGSRAIAGLSMGGYGALKFGVKYPQQFVFVASMSGALGAASWTESDLKGLEFIWRSLQSVYGPESSPTRAANDLGRLYRDLPAASVASLPYIYLDCGTEDQLLQVNRDFVAILMTRKIPHEYRQLPGTHSWTYWDSQVQEVLRIAAKRFSKSL
ncbi:MAG TPA: alpha/beta hydrolase family protein [Pyrinomonadaceae bacterium]|nr:alpha/beta hydrolase family protein [Pyrinomonadaceae bacterium]